MKDGLGRWEWPGWVTAQMPLAYHSFHILMSGQWKLIPFLIFFFAPIKSAQVLTFQRLWDSKCCTQHRALFSPAFDFYAHFKLVREYTGVLFRLGAEVLAFKLPVFPGLLPINCLLIKVLTKERNIFSLVLDFQTRLTLLNGKTNKFKPRSEIP